MEKKLLFAATCLAFLAPAAASAAGSPFLGTWTLDVANSQLAEEAPKSLELVVTKDDGKRIAWNETRVDAKGKTHKTKYDLPLNGKLTQGPDKAWKLSGTKGSDGALNFHAVNTKGDTEDDVCKSDGSTITCEGTATSAGKTSQIKEIYTKKTS